MNVRSAKPVDIHVGRMIARRRAVIGVTQMALAAQLGISFQQLQKYEAAENRVSASRLFEIAKALAATPGDFFPEVAA